MNLSAAERRVAALAGRRTVKKQWQAAWLVRAIQCIDLTTLNGDDTQGRVRRLCAKARHPLREICRWHSGFPATPSPPARSASTTASSQRQWRR